MSQHCPWWTLKLRCFHLQLCWCFEGLLLPRCCKLLAEQRAFSIAGYGVCLATQRRCLSRVVLAPTSDDAGCSVMELHALSQHQPSNRPSVNVSVSVVYGPGCIGCHLLPSLHFHRASQGHETQGSGFADFTGCLSRLGKSGIAVP